jgi:hypothetical protein
MNGLYWVGNLGHVKNKHGKILKPEYSNKGYACVQLRKDATTKKHRLHRLVAEAFIPNPGGLPEVNHKNLDKTDNCVGNLEWVDHKENCSHAMKSGCLSECERPVYCVDLDKTYKSASEASVHTGTCRTSIVKCCRGQLHQAGGMLWRYEK